MNRPLRSREPNLGEITWWIIVGLCVLGLAFVIMNHM